MTHTSLFDYHLPRGCIAQRPARPRDHSRLLILDKKTGVLAHRHFFDLPKFLQPGDAVVLNNTKVFRARLFGVIKGTGRTVEVFLLRPWTDRRWEALGKPGRRLTPGSCVIFRAPFNRSAQLTGTIIQKYPDGRLHIEFDHGKRAVVKIANRIGHVPVPPYIQHEPEQRATYQTIFARRTGSVAAPTAAFHFTPRLIKAMRRKGVTIVHLTLHVGLGTFRPIKTESIEEHTMHPEWVEITKRTAETINRVKKEGRRIIAVGTTVVRALEGNSKDQIANGTYKIKNGAAQVAPSRDFVNLYITPGFKFKIVDALITNFHLPRSTLLVLVCAFVASRGRVLNTYRIAVKRGYRFYSFGDAMFIKN